MVVVVVVVEEVVVVEVEVVVVVEEVVVVVAVVVVVVMAVVDVVELVVVVIVAVVVEGVVRQPTTCQLRASYEHHWRRLHNPNIACMQTQGEIRIDCCISLGIDDVGVAVGHNADANSDLWESSVGDDPY